MLTALPTELQIHIVLHLNTMGDFVRFGSVCKALRVLQQTKDFWKIVAQKLGISIPLNRDPREWVIARHTTKSRVFRCLSEPCLRDFQEIVKDPTIRLHFKSLSGLDSSTLRTFFKTLHGVFQATPTKHLQEGMIRGLEVNPTPQATFRICHSAIFSNFCDRDVLQLKGKINVQVTNLNDEECTHLSTCLAQNQPLCHAVASVLNRWLRSLKKTIDLINLVWNLRESFDPQRKSIDFTLPWGFYLATRPCDLTLSLSDLEEEVQFKFRFKIDILPYQRLFLVDIPDEMDSFLKDMLDPSVSDRHLQVLDLINTIFRLHQLNLDPQGGLTINYDPLAKRVLLCSDDRIHISKIPFESVC